MSETLALAWLPAAEMSRQQREKILAEGHNVMDIVIHHLKKDDVVRIDDGVIHRGPGRMMTEPEDPHIRKVAWALLLDIGTKDREAEAEKSCTTIRDLFVKYGIRVGDSEKAIRRRFDQSDFDAYQEALGAIKTYGRLR